jgi:uncharacterized protein YutE (UPF0331/DUF86 family)
MAAVEPDRLRPRIHHIRERLRRLRQIEGEGWEAFQDNLIVQDAAVRNLQTSIEATVDMANHIVAREGLGTPASYREAIELLVEAGVLPQEKAGAFGAMVSFRNRAVHLYDEIDAEEVYAMIENDLGDFEVFIASIVERYFGEE